MDGTLYDGGTAFPHAVRAEVRDGGLDLSTDSGWSDRVSADLLKRIDAGREFIRLGRADIPGWRLTLPTAAAAELAPLLGREERYGRWIDRIGRNTPLPPLDGRLSTPRLVIAGATLEGVEAEFSEDAVP